MTNLISRRDAMAGIAATSAAVAAGAAAPTTQISATLDRIAYQLLTLVPERATTLGVDAGPHGDMRRRLEDRSPEGVSAQRNLLSKALAELSRLPDSGPDPDTLTSVSVAKSAFRTALDGMALPYGVATIGDWRNTPYGVVQNVGAWLDVPQLLDGDQPVRGAADANAYLARLAAMPAQLDGETVRIRQARNQGLVPPSFLLDKTIAGMTRTIAEAETVAGSLLGPLVRKTAAIPGPWIARATDRPHRRGSGAGAAACRIAHRAVGGD